MTANITVLVLLPSLLAQSAEAPRPAPKEYPVKIEVVADKPSDGMQRIRAKIIIQDGYCVFANPSGQELFTPVIMKVIGRDARIIYPPGETVKDDAIMLDYKVYRGTVTPEATVKRTNGESTPLEVVISLQPFDKAGCHWPPKKLKATIP
jgi:hypothetical protein